MDKPKAADIILHQTNKTIHFRTKRNMSDAILSTDTVTNTLETAQFASICLSEKGYRNEIVETERGHDVRSEIGTARFLRP